MNGVKDNADMETAIRKNRPRLHFHCRVVSAGKARKRTSSAKMARLAIENVARVNMVECPGILWAVATQTVQAAAVKAKKPNALFDSRRGSFRSTYQPMRALRTKIKRREENFSNMRRSKLEVRVADHHRAV
jgi:hypothetical protein